MKWKDSHLQINLLKQESFKGKGFKKMCVNGTNKGLPFSNLTILGQKKFRTKNTFSEIGRLLSSLIPLSSLKVGLSY